MNNAADSDRRNFLDVAGKIGAGLIVGASAAGTAIAQDKKGKGAKKQDEKPEDKSKLGNKRWKA